MLKDDIIRYLGYGNNEPNEHTMSLIDELIDIAKAEIIPKAVHGFFEIESSDFLQGEDINAHLIGGVKCVVLAVTLGTQAEIKLNLFQKTDMEKAVIFDAVCDALVEEFADTYCSNLAKSLAQSNLYLNSRFSPGYGDFPINMQKKIVACINAQKLIGLTVTDSYTLLPRKSITAIMGVFDTTPLEKQQGCESCNMKEKCKMRGAYTCSKQTDFI